MTPVATTWLELLLRDATATELDTHRLELLRDAADAAGVDAEARRALQLQVLLRDRAQRATELAALSDVAARLTSVRDLPGLLSAIAVQARALLRTDVAYLALLEAGELRIRYFDGVLGPAVREVSLSLTAGLAGKVVSTGRAFWTSNYLADTSIEHHPAADQLAGDEALHSILGVPLRAHGRTLGVLFAAERSHRPFSDSEIALLTGLAAHAAAALENARLFDAERASAARLQASAAAVARAVALHERLTDAVVRGGGPAEVVLALADVLDVPVQLIDAADRPLAGPDLGGVAAANMFADRNARRTVVQVGDGGAVVLCPVVATEDYLGCLVVHSPGGADDAQVRLVERGALGIALALVQERAVADAAARHQADLLTALVDGGDATELDRRTAASPVDLRRPHVLAVAEPVDGHAAPARDAAAALARRVGGLVADRSGRSLLLVPADTDLTGLAGHATVGLSDPAVGAAALPAAYAAAHGCLRALLALGRRQVVATAADLGVYRFLLAGGGSGDAADFVQRSIGPLLEHDRRRNTDLAATLAAYLGSGRQHAATAQDLHIHPNTLYQRLGRITSLLGERWREPDRSLEAHLALRLHVVAAALGASPDPLEP